MLIIVYHPTLELYNHALHIDIKAKIHTVGFSQAK